MRPSFEDKSQTTQINDTRELYIQADNLSEIWEMIGGCELVFRTQENKRIPCTWSSIQYTIATKWKGIYREFSIFL